jgi:hypothetical protein
MQSKPIAKNKNIGGHGTADEVSNHLTSQSTAHAVD